MPYSKVARNGQNSTETDFRGPEYPQEMNICTICGTPVQAMLDHKNFTGLEGGVREGRNMAKNAPHTINPKQNYWLRSPPELPKWVKDHRLVTNGSRAPARNNVHS